MLTRRGFAAGVGKFGAFGLVADGMFAAVSVHAALPPLVHGARPNLKIGVLSDIHLHPLSVSPSKRDIFEKALLYCRDQGVDGVLIPGDLITDGETEAMELVAETWFKVFPGDRGADGRPVARLFLLGNHDCAGKYMRMAELKGRLADPKVKAEWFCLDRARHWERLFHEKYEPIFYKEVKGYRFILRNWIAPHLGDKDTLLEFIAAHGAELRGDKPFFFAQHPHPKGTCCQSWTDNGGKPWIDCSDDGRSTEILSRFPNCIALSGHSHTTLTDEHTIWQGAFTSVGCSCLGGYAFMFPGRENGQAHDDFKQITPRPMTMPKLAFTASKQGMMMEVYDDRIVFHRREFNTGLSLGADWVVPLPSPGTRPYAFAPRREAAAVHPPQFLPGAKVKVEEKRLPDRAGEKKDMAVVTFPSIPSRDGAMRAFDFAVRAETRIGDCTRTLVEKRVYSPGMLRPEALDKDDASCTFAKEELALNRDVRFIVTPLDCWGNCGKPISSDWRRFS